MSVRTAQVLASGGRAQRRSSAHVWSLHTVAKSCEASAALPPLWEAWGRW